MEKIKWSEKITNEEILELIVEKRTLLNNILRREAYLTELKGIGRRRTQILDNLRNRRRYL